MVNRTCVQPLYFVPEGKKLNHTLGNLDKNVIFVGDFLLFPL